MLVLVEMLLICEARPGDGRWCWLDEAGGNIVPVLKVGVLRLVVFRQNQAPARKCMMHYVLLSMYYVSCVMYHVLRMYEPR